MKNMTTPNTTFYPYEPITAGSSLLIYSGTSITVKPNADGTVTQPVNTSAFQPPTAGMVAVSPGSTQVAQINSYWTGFGWQVGIDMRTIPAAQLQRLALNSYMGNFAATISNLASWYPVEEQQSWVQQIAEANTINNLAAGAPIPASVVLIPVLAQERGITAQAFASIVLNNAATYQKGYDAALATFQQDRRLAQAATQLSDLPGADHPLLIGMSQPQMAAMVASYVASA